MFTSNSRLSELIKPPNLKEVGSYLTEFGRDAASIALSSKPQMSDLGINVLYYRAAWAAKEMQLLGFTRIAVRANIFCFTIFAL